MKKKLIAFFLILLFFISHFLNFSSTKINFLAQAQSGDVEINLGDYLTLNNGQKVSEVFNTPASMVNLLVRVVFVAVGLILLFLIIFSGLSMVAGGTSDNKDKAKSTMTSALIGFIVIFGAYWIMQIIKVLTGADIGF